MNTIRSEFIFLKNVLCFILFAGTSVSWSEESTAYLSNFQTDVFELNDENKFYVLQFSVNNEESFIIDINTEETPVDVALYDPSGMPHDLSSLERHTIDDENSPPLGAALFTEGEHVLLEVDAPDNGVWRLELIQKNYGDSVSGNITRFISSDLGVKLVTSRINYSSDQNIVIAALVFLGENPVEYADVKVDVYSSENALSPEVSGLTLMDDGFEPDSAAGDGIYTAAISSLEPKSYLVQSEINLADGTYATAATDFLVTPVFARLSGNYTDLGVDFDSDGLFDEIQVQVEVNVTQSGEYSLHLALKGSESEITSGVRLSLSEGMQQIAVSFPSSDIRKFIDEDGPYEIRLAILNKISDEENNQKNLVVDKLASLGLTQNYLLEDLERPPVILSTDTVTFSPVDNNGNGLYDILRVDFNVELQNSDTYKWSADIRSLDGKIIGLANGSSYLYSGVSSVSLIFSGIDIGSSGINGPYYISNVSIYGNRGGAGVEDKLATTREYMVSEFEGYLTIDQDLDGVLDSVDLCPNTNIPDDSPSSTLGKFRYSLQTLPEFDNNPGPLENIPVFTISDTQGCSCDDLLDSGRFVGLESIQRERGCNIQTMSKATDSGTEYQFLNGTGDHEFISQ